MTKKNLLHWLATTQCYRTKPQIWQTYHLHQMGLHKDPLQQPWMEILDQQTTTLGIVQQLLDVIMAQTWPTQITPTTKAYSKTSPEHCSLCSWCRLTDIEKISPFWKAFHQATTDNRCLQILEKYMAQEKSTDFFISYSLRPDWIKDIAKQKSWYPLSN